MREQVWVMIASANGLITLSRDITIDYWSGNEGTLLCITMAHMALTYWLIHHSKHTIQRENVSSRDFDAFDELRPCSTYEPFFYCSGLDPYIFNKMGIFWLKGCVIVSGEGLETARWNCAAGLVLSSIYKATSGYPVSDTLYPRRFHQTSPGPGTRLTNKRRGGFYQYPRKQMRKYTNPNTWTDRGVSQGTWSNCLASNRWLSEHIVSTAAFTFNLHGL